jgi:peptide/nickel transport system ATP-binding protein
MSPPLLTIHDLAVQFRTYAGTVHALNGVDLKIHRGEALGLVGETGCGKSMVGLSIMQLLPKGGEVVSGSIEFNGEQLIGRKESFLQEVRGARIAMVFQDPTASLNPLYSVGKQLGMVISKHQQLEKRKTRERTLELLEMVELPHPAQMAERYPHELSGGMKQRVSIAMALSSGAELLIADEPTTALDVTVQAQILDLLDRLRVSQSVALLLITHDLAVVAEACQRVAVLYSGRVVETGPVDRVLLKPSHPYTQALLQAVPNASSRGVPLRPIPGSVASGLRLPEGCLFRPRCDRAMDICFQQPPTVQIGSDLTVACHLYSEREQA